ncbi:hypothetical protein Tco_0464016, partial [Tanacetum coccineum]
TDNAKISRLRKRPKTEQTRTWERKENTRAGRMLSKVNKSQFMVNSGQP